MDPIEITATIFGFICVWLTLKENIWCWPTGLVQVTLYVYVFFQARLYSDMGLHVIYILMQFYGWYNWLHGGRNKGRLTIARLSTTAAAFWAVTAVLGTAALGTVMSRHTDADLPYWDAAQTVLSLIAQWLMAKKVLESWLIWITVDVICVGLYTVKRLYPTAGLYATFLVMATAGFLAWKRNPQPA
ncbi:MAG: nicotinamide riboside transporter PnuC [Thermodesulfobacteriota bacterium]